DGQHADRQHRRRAGQGRFRRTYRRPTKAFQDGLAAGGAGLRILQLRGATAVEGGIPLTEGGRIIGAIGVSGGSSEQDGVVAAAGLAAMGR
ncbi:MAG TPA: heme-binding protein, partial [Ramlibacter sp.]|uniref:heme-binding protein n=1 Tax=Ramlibacter sp. TaxID=1917967 RepID=UPI002D80EE89